uniref:Uncharacterized protein n=1 Tax=Oryza sativa subsp. japonica TaxID=39947 RepID=Q6YZ95_ORYSJ|nr:hypothetical protein [Oryza sativa Japonica Group]BAD05782.1 hypothetical protein [Oryza sativa Japonica Group]
MAINNSHIVLQTRCIVELLVFRRRGKEGGGLALQAILFLTVLRMDALRNTPSVSQCPSIWRQV